MLSVEMIAGCFFSSRGGITIYATAVVVFGTSTVLNAMEAGDHEQQEFLDRSVFSDALRAMRMDYNAARSAAARCN